MRIPELFGLAAADLAVLLLALSLPAAQAVDFNPVSSPNLDLSQLGRVALTGNFDSISVYSYQDQNERPFTLNGSQSLLTQMPNGVFASLVSSDASILSMCPFVRMNGDLAGIIVGGNFTSLGGTPTQGVALWDPSNNNITPLPGLNGSVSAVYCNQATDTVYVGGNFHGGNSTNAIAWVGMTGWANMPFAGFNGPVNAITKAPDGNILFGGSFTGLGNTTLPTDQDAQIINLSSANITSGPNSTQAGFIDPSNIVCNTNGQSGPGNTWLAADGPSAFWKAEMNFGYEPTKLRLWNTNVQGRGSKTFRFTAFPINGIMNFTYTDPETNQNLTCDATCPLASNSSIPFQDFHFVNVIGMDAFQIDVSDVYGAGAGLNGIELFQNDIYAYAAPGLNEPACAATQFPSNATSTGPWQVTPSGGSGAEYLTAQLTGPNVNSGSAEVTFLPDIKQSGNYTVTIYTPGCQQDNSCSTRGIANVTGLFTSGGQPANQQIYQTNDFDKYDQIYHGFVDQNSGSFRPSITLTPLDNQNDSIGLVALRVRFQLQSASSSGLNGLFEYDTSKATVSTDFSADKYDAAGSGLSPGATVNSLAVVGQSTYIGGNFTTSNYSNIFYVNSGQSNPLANQGLNNAVGTMVAWGNLLFMGGNFTDTATPSNQNLKSVAMYDTSAQTWSALGGGVDGTVDSIVPLLLNITGNVPETCITVNGQFSKVLASGSNAPFDSNGGLAIYVPSHKEWLHNLNYQTESIQGKLTATTNVTGSTPLLAGSVASQGWELSDSVSLSTSNGNADLAPIGLKMQPSSTSSNLHKRDAITQNMTGAVTGLFDTDNGRNITVLAGSFKATASNGSTIDNLAILSANSDGTQTVTGLAPGIDSSSTFRALSRNSDTLAAGGQITGNVNGGSIDGLVLWNLASSSYVSPQPPALTGDQVAVYAISTRPSSSDLYVGGNFGAGGSLACPSLCYYTGGQWNRPGTGIDGSIGSMLWQGGSQLLVAGNLTVSNNVTYVAQYNADSQAWTIPTGSGAVPGPVTALTQASADGSSYWVAGISAKNGTAYLVQYDGTNFNPVPQIFGASTVVHGLSVVSLSQDHDNNNLLDNSLALMITGQINVPSFGNASAVLFNGTTLTPLILSNSGNEPGSLSQVITESMQSFSSENTGLKVGYVVAIALAIALGVMMLLVGLGLLIERRRRKAEGYRPAPQNYFEKTANMGRIPPERLFSSLNQPTAPRV